MMEIYTVFIFLSTVVYATCQTTASGTLWIYTQPYTQPSIDRSVANQYYSGIFFTTSEIELKERQWRSEHTLKWGNTSRTNRFRRQNANTNHDYDQCCPTHPSHRHESHLNNTNYILRAIVHMESLKPPKFQWYPHAECVDVGSCSGICRLETITVYLLVYKMRSNGWPFEFDTFEVPGYCSCKSS